MSSKSKINYNHVTTSEAEDIYREIELNRESIRRSIKDIKNSFNMVKENSMETINNPMSTLTDNLNISESLKNVVLTEILKERPFQTLLVTAAAGFLFGKFIQNKPLELPTVTKLSQGVVNLSPSLASTIATPVVDKLKEELAETANIVIEEIFQNLRNKMQSFIAEHKK